MRRVLPLCCLVALTSTAFGQVHTVSGVSIVSRPKAYRGPCPATLHFIATIHVSRQPALVEYVWERSDGATSPRQRMEVRGASRGVQDTWTLGVAGVHADVWERLRILAPTGISSAVAHVRLTCR